MAKPQKNQDFTSTASLSQTDDFSQELIKQLNKEHGSNIAFNLASDNAPTDIKRWIPSGSKQLDAILSNKLNGGYAEGRIIEVQAQPGIGKSHIAFHLAKSVQEMGGIAVYVDTENATNVENLTSLGIDISRRFVFVQSSCTEEVFSVIESTIKKARGMTKDVPVAVIWDSVSQTAPKAELEGEYDQNTIGLQARVLSKGMRKIANVIANEKVILFLVSQQRMKIGVAYGDPSTTPGGMAVPYASSVRIKLTGGKQLEDKDGNIYGIEVTAKTIKNKTAKPFRQCTFQIHFGKGIVEHENVFDFLREHFDKKGPVTVDGIKVSVEGAGAWKTFKGIDTKTGEVVIEKKFNKSEFGSKVLYNKEYKKYVDAMMEAAYIMKPDEDHTTLVGIDMNSLDEVEAASMAD